jgi:hypothetical protein
MATRNRYAEIMAQYAQSQPFSFTGIPSSYYGGQSGYSGGYTGGFEPAPYTPYVAPVNRYAELMAQPFVGAAGGGYGASAEGQAARDLRFRDMTNEQRLAHLATNEAIGGFIDKGARLLPVLSQGSYLSGLFNDKAAAEQSARNAAATSAAAATGTDVGFSSAQFGAAPAIAPAPAPVQMVNITERWNGEESPPAGQGWQAQALGKGDVGYTRTVSVPGNSGTDTSWMGGGGAVSGGGGMLGNQSAATRAALRSNEGYGPGLAQGGHVSMQHLQGPNPMGPDDGYGALKMGEYVINDKAVKKYGIELMDAINSGKISKGKLLGLLEM